MEVAIPSYPTLGNPVSSLGNENVENLDPGEDGIVEIYTSLIQQYLSVMCVDNAIFLAERFVACKKSNDSQYLLALCHHRSGAPKRALGVLENCQDDSPKIQYLVAKCCLELGDYGRAEEALLNFSRQEYRKSRGNSLPSAADNSPEAMDTWIITTTPCPIPNGAAGLHMLGNICRASNRKNRAKQYYRMSLKLDPFLWSSFEYLCELGGADDLEPHSVFGVHPPQFEAVKPLQDRNILSPSSFMLNSVTPANVRSLQHSFGAGTPSTTPAAALFTSATTRKKLSQFETPGLTPIPASTSVLGITPADAGDSKVLMRAEQVAARRYYQPSPETPHTAEIRTSLQYLRGLGRQVETESTHGTGDTPLRRGGGMREQNTTDQSAMSSSFSRQPRALFMSADNSTPKESDGIGQQQLSGSEGSHAFNGDSSVPATRQEGIREILGLLCLIGSAWRRLCQYCCREALKIFSQLPQTQQQTGWILHQQGRAHFETNDFLGAGRCLELMQSVEPYRMKGLDLLSTVYWQLKKEVELAHLAQKTVDFDKRCPEAWCIVGNCFSLQKEHETALSYFKRSLQLDPTFTYSHTLSGYEFTAQEDFDKAIACFRNAIRSDDRHYNAWYGLGAIYHRQEKYDLAEYHFERAASINPQSSVLRCNLGISQFSNGKAYQALATLEEAFRLDPRNPQARFQRATIFSALNRPAEALSELEKVRNAAPREATVHFAIGKMLKRCGRLEEAMKSFLTAMDLDPKDSQLIKSAMDKLEEPDVDEGVAGEQW
ncbi:cycle protein 27 homolog [Seminavis robusta]|uniref:Cycle protein 27 homolog n=1 Tax=Seminavis robusta TaxID=568900 RepID=A0A9N8HAB5_9STRA|nr:cycle protein 27 homolog [Seminavis robusta]|eukprot:Sro313_g114790.1 cycle protein 27 homolog (773) ;mRNA; r:30495-33143